MQTGLNELLRADREHIWHPFSSLTAKEDPILVTGGKGVYLERYDGGQILDAVSSWWVNLHGHSNPVIADAIHKQALTLEHVIFAGFTHTPAITLSANLLKILPDNLSRIFFSDNGSTSVEVAIKMALQYWFNLGSPRKKIVALSGAYHGDTFGAMSVGDRNTFTLPFSDHLFEVSFIDVPTDENFESIRKQFYSLISQGETAAFIYEPLVQGAAGMVMYKVEYLNELLNEAKEQGVLCIADEVFTGFGRTGKYFASDYLNYKPDLLCASKGITGGALPLGVTCCSREVEAAFLSNEKNRTFFHGHSYTANPLSCAAANASFELLTSTSCQNQIRIINQCHSDFQKRVAGHQRVKDARVLGTILAIELKTAEDTSYFNSIRDRAYTYFLNRDILLRPLGNIIYVLPPYVIREKELETIYTAIIDFLNELG